MFKKMQVFLVLYLIFSFSTNAQYHSSDYEEPRFVITLPELLRLIQIHNYGSYHCDNTFPDGYALGIGDTSCSNHSADFNPQDWVISFEEVLRVVQFYKSGSYHIDITSEDGFQPGNGNEPLPGTETSFLGIPFVWVPSGSFYMGTVKTPTELAEIYGGNISLFTSEYPQHLVVISSGFWMSQTEITQKQWHDIMKNNPSNNVGDDLPVENLSWDDCQRFVENMNKLGNGIFRLPSEAEWEYACRAGSISEFYFGDDAEQLNNYGWHFYNSDYHTHPVKQKKPNAWGLYDMHGNVWEWCQDWYDANYYPNSPTLDPTGPATGSYKVLRGGTCLRTAARCRSAFRSWNAPDLTMPDQGLRICRNPD